MDSASTIRWDEGGDGIVVLTLDDPRRSANTMDAAYAASMEAVVDRLEAERERVAGVVLTSAKSSFFAGGDLDYLRAIGPDQAADVAAWLRGVKRDLRRLETLGRPVVAAIGGAALGGGLEICLACHRRIAVENPRAVLGFPEVTLGLLPGAGGVARSVRLLGVERALGELLLEGRRIAPARALELGLVDELVATSDDLVSAAKAWIAANPDAAQRWDARDYALPGGAPSQPPLRNVLPALPANLRKRLKGASYPAPRNILAAAVEGAQVDLDNALEIETRYFVDLVTGQVAKSMIQAFFFDMRAVGGDRGRPAGRERFAARKVAVLGAGMMGAAIAYVCAKAGIEVVLKDVSAAAARRGKGYSEDLVRRAVERGRMSAADGDALLGRIVATADAADAAGADLLIEAVFEDLALKRAVLAEIEPLLDGGALLGSNTSTLPISELAEGVDRPHDFIGLHFFSPVDKMPLLEIVKGRETSDESVQRALDLARQIGKTPIVVNDSRGFFTSRVILTFINEGLAMLGEGVPAPTVEQASSQAGYPAPVLALTDELNLELLRNVRDEARAAAGGDWRPHAGETVLDRMVGELDRAGRAAGGGFYDYRDGRRVGLWPGLVEAFGGANRDHPLADLIERLLFVETLETVKCLDEGVIESVADANVGSILGIGFPRWTGGVLQYANGYAGGLEGFVARARELAGRYGERFEPPPSLVERAARGELYADAPAAVPA